MERWGVEVTFPIWGRGKSALGSQAPSQPLSSPPSAPAERTRDLGDVRLLYSGARAWGPPSPSPHLAFPGNRPPPSGMAHVVGDGGDWKEVGGYGLLGPFIRAPGGGPTLYPSLLPPEQAIFGLWVRATQGLEEVDGCTGLVLDSSRSLGSELGALDVAHSSAGWSRSRGRGWRCWEPRPVPTVESSWSRGWGVGDDDK